jgi:hypothetical protein
MNTSTSQNSRQQVPSVAASRRRTAGQSAHREHMPMPRSTTRVIWTTAEGATVVYGEIA